MLEDLYKKAILDHYRRPRHGAALVAPDGEFKADLPVCGDVVVLQVCWRDGRLAEVAFFGRGCSLCLASGSILAEWVHGRDGAGVAAALATFERMMGGAEPGPEVPESVSALRGVLAYPARIPCVRLGWNALAAALAERESRGGETK